MDCHELHCTHLNLLRAGWPGTKPCTWLRLVQSTAVTTRMANDRIFVFLYSLVWTMRFSLFNNYSRRIVEGFLYAFLV